MSTNQNDIIALRNAVQYAMLQVITTTNDNNNNIQLTIQQQLAIQTVTELTLRYVQDIMSCDLYAFSNHRTISSSLSSSSSSSSSSINEHDVLLLIRRCPQHIQTQVRTAIEQYKSTLSSSTSSSTTASGATTKAATAAAAAAATTTIARDVTTAATKTTKTNSKKRSLPTTKKKSTRTTTSMTTMKTKKKKHQYLDDVLSVASSSSHLSSTSSTTNRKDIPPATSKKKDNDTDSDSSSSIDISRLTTNNKINNRYQNRNQNRIDPLQEILHKSSNDMIPSSSSKVQGMSEVQNTAIKEGIVPVGNNSMDFANGDDNVDDDDDEMDHILSTMNIPQQPQPQAVGLPLMSEHQNDTNTTIQTTKNTATTTINHSSTSNNNDNYNNKPKIHKISSSSKKKNPYNKNQSNSSSNKQTNLNITDECTKTNIKNAPKKNCNNTEALVSNAPATIRTTTTIAKVNRSLLSSTSKQNQYHPKKRFTLQQHQQPSRSLLSSSVKPLLQSKSNIVNDKNDKENDYEDDRFSLKSESSSSTVESNYDSRHVGFTATKTRLSMIDTIIQQTGVTTSSDKYKMGHHNNNNNNNQKKKRNTKSISMTQKLMSTLSQDSLPSQC